MLESQPVEGSVMITKIKVPQPNPWDYNSLIRNHNNLGQPKTFSAALATESSAIPKSNVANSTVNHQVEIGVIKGTSKGATPILPVFMKIPLKKRLFSVENMAILK